MNGIKGLKWYARQDLNLRPLVPENNQPPTNIRAIPFNLLIPFQLPESRLLGV